MAAPVLHIDPAVLAAQQEMLNDYCYCSHVNVEQGPDGVTVSISIDGELIKAFVYTPAEFVGAFDRVQLEVRAALTGDELYHLLCSELYLPKCKVVVELPAAPADTIYVYWMHDDEKVGEYLLHTRKLAEEMPVCLAEMTAKLCWLALPKSYAPLHRAAMAWLKE
jgi:hypothetical protein